MTRSNREALRELAERGDPPRPRLPLFRSGKPWLAEGIDRTLARLGRR